MELKQCIVDHAFTVPDAEHVRYDVSATNRLPKMAKA